jgi:uracil-DNA glycosylase family 4
MTATTLPVAQEQAVGHAFPLKNHSNCTNCDFHKTCSNPGIGGRLVRFVDASARTQDAVLVVAQSPGWHEDQQNRILVGLTGEILSHYLDHLPKLDVYATNAVKCLPPVKVDPKIKEIKACNTHLVDDIREVQKHYRNVYVLCVGRSAVQAVLRANTLTKAFEQQGKFVSKLPWGGELDRPVQVWSTFHPAALARTPNKGMMATIRDHVDKMRADIVGDRAETPETTRYTPKEFVVHGACGMNDYALVSLDIETYGILKGRKQTAFNPISSIAIDGVPISHQIVSVAVAVQTAGTSPPDPNDKTKLQTCVFDFRKSEDLKFFKMFLIKASTKNVTLLGVNLLFDLSYLCAQIPWFYDEIVKRSSFNILDVMVLSFLDNPHRPERSLKALTPLLLDGPWTKYDERGTQYDDFESLAEYNLKDVINPIMILHEIRRRAAEMSTPTFSPVTIESLSFYSDLMVTLLHMTMVGVAFDREELLATAEKFQSRVESLIAGAPKNRDGLILKGKGSSHSYQTLFESCAALINRDHQNVEWEMTEKTGLISTSKSNTRKIMSLLPDSATIKKSVRTLNRYKGYSKSLNSQIKPLIRSIGKFSTAHPSWFPVPGRFESNDGSYSDDGGTRQCRATCKRPALQTAPTFIKNMMVSRYPNGVLFAMDYSQLEMRVMAMLSGDPNLLNVYANGRDLHHETLEGVLGHPIDKHARNYEKLRRQAKFTNFGTIYGIEPPGLTETWWRFMGIEEPISVAANFINGFFRTYPLVLAYHTHEIECVKRDGHLVVPITKQWLPFSPPDRNGKFDKAILNYRVQATAANITLTAHHEIVKFLTQEGLGVSPLNIYDSILVDARDSKLFPAVAERCQEIMRDNALIRDLRSEFRSVPFEVDMKILHDRSMLRYRTLSI